jgi:energy-converting hydrogenase Eha subunit A
VKNLNYKKLILVGCISAFVAVLTSVLGVAGTVIGSVISSVLYNMLSEALEKPVSSATFSTNFEWEIAYIFPLAVIALIQLMLIFALLSEWGILPGTFLNVFMVLQNFANNNLYRILGIGMLVISIYPFVLKPDFIKKSHGMIIAFVGLIFLARGFADAGNVFTNMYDIIFVYFDFPIAVIALILILFVIIQILSSAKESEKEFRLSKHQLNEENFTEENIRKVHHSKKHNDFDYHKKREDIRVKRHDSNNNHEYDSDVTFKNTLDDERHKTGINESSSKIQFESNDILDDYKK